MSYSSYNRILYHMSYSDKRVCGAAQGLGGDGYLHSVAEFFEDLYRGGDEIDAEVVTAASS